LEFKEEETQKAQIEMIAKSKASTLESSKSSNQPGFKPPIIGGSKTDE
jgi:hypothetical protein